jgi:hypothetical protein
MNLPTTTTNYQEEKGLVRAWLESFPATFGLRAFPGDTFKLCPRASYYSTRFGVQLYVLRQRDNGDWLEFAKSTPQELTSNITRD